MKNIIAIGAGRVGSAMIRDLLVDPSNRITAVDYNSKQLEQLPDHPNLKKIQGDIVDARFRKKVLAFPGLVLNAVPGHLGFVVLKEAIEAGKKIVDICFSPEDPLALNEIAIKHKAIAIVDMGVAPGMSNVLAGCAAREMDEIFSLKILVGGLPKERKKPFEYQAGFSPIDVIEEYTRPARFIEDGRIVSKDALTDIERVNVSGIGSLEAFNSDGLRTLMFTIKAENMVEKTMRYPGHAEIMKLFRETGLFDEKAIDIGGQMVVPRDLTSKLLFNHWEMAEGDEDFTVMFVMAEGKKDHQRVIFAASLYDEYDREQGIHSMARTTGYAATSAVRLLLSGKIKKYGVIPPEELAKSETISRFMMEDQQSRGIHYHITFEREEDWSSVECGA